LINEPQGARRGQIVINEPGQKPKWLMINGFE
jgi:hypothetical protein